MIHDRSIDHPQVLYSRGGGVCPEQHEGKLLDGRYFYLRMRSATARLTISKTPMDEDKFWEGYFIVDHDPLCPTRAGGLCAVINVGQELNCRSYSEHGQESLDMLQAGLCDSPYDGMFDDEDQRNEVFAQLLQEIEESNANNGS